MRDLFVTSPMTAPGDMTPEPPVLYRRAGLARRIRNFPGPGSVIMTTVLAWILTGRVTALAATLPPGGRIRSAAVASPSGLALAGYAGAGMLLAGLYLLPVLIGWARQVPGLGRLAVLDVMLGWTGIGWLLALLTALRRPGTSAARGSAPQSCPQARARPLQAVSAAGLRHPGDAPPLPFLPGPDEAS